MNLNEFISKVKELGIELNDNQINQFNKYYELLVEYNKVMNLTGITEYEEVLEKHFYDSLTMANKVNLNNSTLVDIGAGAGFPCIPLKIAFPSLDVTVVDSLAKRMKFLEIVIKELNLENIRCLAMRGEDFAKQHREEFDFVTARAVANMPLLCELCIPLVRVGGKFIVMKGLSGKEELNDSKKALRVLGCKVENVYESHSEDMTRINIECLKIKPTPKGYPRAFAKMKKSPLRGE